MCEKDYEDEYEDEQEEEYDDSENTVSGCPIVTEDRVVFKNRQGKVKWRFDIRSHKFNWLELPAFFESAPDDVKTDLIEWCRSAAYAKYRCNPYPKKPQSVKDFMELPETVALRKATEKKE